MLQWLTAATKLWDRTLGLSMATGWENSMFFPNSATGWSKEDVLVKFADVASTNGAIPANGAISGFGGPRTGRDRDPRSDSGRQGLHSATRATADERDGPAAVQRHAVYVPGIAQRHVAACCRRAGRRRRRTVPHR